MLLRINNLDIDTSQYKNLDKYIQSLDAIKRMIELEMDYLIVIDAMNRKGTGKSTLALFTALYLDPDFDLEKQLTFADISMMKSTFRKLKPGSVVMVDEAGAALHALDFMKKDVKNFAKTLEIARAKQLVLILILPTVYYLTKQIRLGVDALISVRKRGLARFYIRDELIKAWAPYITTYSPTVKLRTPKPLYSFSWPPLDKSRVYREYYKKKMDFINNWLEKKDESKPTLRGIVGIKEVAEYCGVSTETIRRWVHEGLIPPEAYQKKGKKYYFYAGKLRKLI